MNPDSENFDALRRVLALKRHEQPPPGYFDQFSSQVIARIKAGETGEPASAVSRFFRGASWWNHVVSALEAKPAVAGAFGAAVCALLISGIVYSENAPTPASAGLAEPETGSSLAPATVAMGDSQNESQVVSVGTNSVASSPASLWSEIPFPKAQLVSFPTAP